VAAGRVATGIFLSRVAGLARESVIAQYFGTSYLADAWRAAIQIPNVVQNLLGEGSLSASFVPVYARLLGEGREEEAGRVAGAVLALLVAAAGGMALIGGWAAPGLVFLFPGFLGDARAEIVVTLLRILFPMTAVLAVSAWALGVLNSHRKFFVSYVAPVFWNLSMILALLLAGSLAAGNRSLEELLTALAWGALAGGVLQLVFQLAFAVPHLRQMRLAIGPKIAEVREVVRNFVPMMAQRGVANLSALVDLQLASLLAGGAVARLGYARILYMLPISLFGLSIAAAELPELSRDRQAGLAVVRKRTEQAIATALFWLVPFAAAYIVLRTEAMAVYRIFEGSLGGTGFDFADAAATGWVLAAFAAGLPATGVSRVLSSAFFSLGDTRTPAKIVALRMAVAAAAGAALMFPMDSLSASGQTLGAAGLAAGAAIGGWLVLGLLVRRFRTRLSGFSFRRAKLPWLLGAAVSACAAGLAAKQLLTSLSALHPLAELLGTSLPFAAVYLAVTEAAGISPLGVRARVRTFARRFLQ